MTKKKDFVPVGNRIPADEIDEWKKHSEEWEYYRDKFGITGEDIIKAIEEKVEWDKENQITEKRLEKYTEWIKMGRAYYEKYGKFPKPL